jgi:hypothetical protein
MDTSTICFEYIESKQPLRCRCSSAEKCIHHHHRAAYMLRNAAINTVWRSRASSQYAARTYGSASAHSPTLTESITIKNKAPKYPCPSLPVSQNSHGCQLRPVVCSRSSSVSTHSWCPACVETCMVLMHVCFREDGPTSPHEPQNPAPSSSCKGWRDFSLFLVTSM